jgi:hypothetical protein
MDGTFSIIATVSGAMTIISIDGHVWAKNYDSLAEAGVEAAKLHIISDRTARNIFNSKQGQKGCLLEVDLEELPKHDFHRVR